MSTDATDEPVRPVTPGRQALLERAERASGQAEREVRIVDAQAIRALAHEARQRVIDVLYTAQQAMTATQLAELTGLTPSAMSYHLRALERWGVVIRAEADDDARNRPWRAAGTTISIGGEGEAARSARTALRAQVFRAVERRIRHVQSLPKDQRAGYVGLAVGELWLTADQVETVGLAVERVIVEMLESGWTNEPGEGRDRVAFVWSLLPDPYPVDAEPGLAE